VNNAERRSQQPRRPVRRRRFAIEQAKPTEPFVYRVDIAMMPCKELVWSIIRHRGERAAAVLATKLNAELARRGKKRVVLQRAARNGNGAHVRD
jgi:hypothetical protein